MVTTGRTIGWRSLRPLRSRPSLLALGAGVLVVAAVGGLLSACSGGGGGGGDGGRPEGSSSADFDCDGSCAHQSISDAEVRTVLSQAVRGAQSLGVAATFAVVDRVGNVLSVYRMAGAPATTRIDGQVGAVGGLEGLVVPSTLAAISKAGTGAYLSSQGNAFSTRTASQIVQEHFNPGERNQPGGPLFGVQFSQLMCGDVTVRNSDITDGRPLGGNKFSFGGSIGPRPMPLGLSADPGGIPLYKQGDVVGGLGVEFDGLYRLDRVIIDFDNDPEERIALYGSLGFEAPSERVAPNINVGKSLRYTDISYDDLEPLPEIAVELAASGFVAIPEFTSGVVRSGVQYGSVASGIALTTRAGVPAATLVKPDGSPRYPTRSAASPGGAALSASEVDAILDSAIFTAFRARAAIRRPLDAPAQVSIWVVDDKGSVLGMTRTSDGPIFGVDVALQKARAAALLSSRDAGAALSAAGMGSYVNAAAQVLGASTLSSGTAFANRSIGNLARPFFPDGIEGKPNGPFSLPFPGTVSGGATWSPLNDGLQLDLVFGGIATALQLAPSATFPASCTSASLGGRAANGIQIFPGAVPLYRGATLVGAIGISGDGVDQDDLIAFYGVSRRGLDAVGHLGVGDPVLGFNAPVEMRADTLVLSQDNLRLRYVNCPEGPFRGDDDQNVCDGL